MDNQSIAWIWQVTGCQHSLQPTGNDFEPPSIPALTPRGFSRWEALEILLGPHEHVPFIQYAIKNWNLKHPETGEAFPPDLPRDVFPLEADPEVNRWHETCADRLWKDAESKDEPPKEEEPQPAKAKPAAEHPEPKYAYVNPNNPFQPSARQRDRPGPGPRPAERARPFSYVHVPGRSSGHPGQRMAPRSPEREYREPPPDDRERRRSFSDYPSPTQGRPSEEPPRSYSGTHLNPDNIKRPAQGRRHSHPRQYSSDSSSDDEPEIPSIRRRMPQSPPPPTSRRFPPTAPNPPATMSNGSSTRAHRSELREGDLKRRSANSPLGSLREKVSEKVSGIFAGGRPMERPRTDSRQSSHIDSPRSRRSPQRVRAAPMPAYAQSDSDGTSDPETSAEDLRRRRRLQQERERRNYRDRGRPYELDRELDDDLDPASRRQRQYLRRPETYRRTSSHADIDRRREQAILDSRGRDRFRDDRRRFERRSPDARGEVSPIGGVSGRRYPDAVYA